jgi:hypothetical protein
MSSKYRGIYRVGDEILFLGFFGALMVKNE